MAICASDELCRPIGINPELTAKLDASGNVSGVTMTYTRDAVRQYLGYGRMYRSQ